MMRTGKKIFIPILVFFIVVVITIACSNSPAQSTPAKKKEDPDIPVEVVSVNKGTIHATFSGSATLEAEEEALVVAKVNGVVKEIYSEEGSIVNSGQVLAKLDDQQYKLELAQARSKLEKLASEFKRNEELFKRKIFSQETYERIKFDYESQKSAYNLAKLRQDYTSIQAPIAGVVAERLIKVGNMVNINQPTFRITDLNHLWAILHVPEKEMYKLKKNFPAFVSADALPGKEFSAHILRISPVVSADTGTLKVTVEVTDNTRQLKPGMFTRVNIIHDTHEGTLLVPKNAVIVEDRESSVFVLKEGKAVKRIVKTGYENSSHIEILSGLSAAEKVVTSGISSLKDGVKVQVVEQ